MTKLARSFKELESIWRMRKKNLRGSFVNHVIAECVLGRGERVVSVMNELWEWRNHGPVLVYVANRLYKFDRNTKDLHHIYLDQ